MNWLKLKFNKKQERSYQEIEFPDETKTEPWYEVFLESCFTSAKLTEVELDEVREYLSQFENHNQYKTKKTLPLINFLDGGAGKWDSFPSIDTYKARAFFALKDGLTETDQVKSPVVELCNMMKSNQDRFSIDRSGSNPAVLFDGIHILDCSFYDNLPICNTRNDAFSLTESLVVGYHLADIESYQLSVNQNAERERISELLGVSK